MKRVRQSGDTSIGVAILQPSVASTLKERSNTHQQPGPLGYRMHASCTERLMEICRAQPNWASLNDSQKETVYMTQHKLARILTGNPNVPDHWQDIAGYNTLIVNEFNDGVA